VGDLAHVPVETLVAALGKSLGQHMHALAWADDDRPVVAEAKVKSISHEETYAHDIADRDELHREIVRMGDAVGARLRESGLGGRTVQIKVRFHDFATISRSHTVGGPVDTGPEIIRVAAMLLDGVDVSSGVRLLGVGITNLMEGTEAQLSFDDFFPANDARTPQWDEATRAVDEVRRRFGERSLGPAVLADGGGVRVKRRGEQQWGPEE
jgi:DNA polymerase-4